MNWKIFTKMVEVDDGGIAMRWYWRKPALDGRQESALGFTTRNACVADAQQHGYSMDLETPQQVVE